MHPAEKAAQKPPKQGAFQQKLEPALLLLANPYKLWALGSFEVKRIVLKMAVQGRILYDRNQPVSTALKPLQDGGFMGVFGGGVKDGGPQLNKLEPELLEKLADYSLQLQPLYHEIMAILEGGAE